MCWNCFSSRGGASYQVACSSQGKPACLLPAACCLLHSSSPSGNPAAGRRNLRICQPLRLFGPLRCRDYM